MVARDANLLPRQAREETESVLGSVVVATLLLRLPLLDEPGVAKRGEIEEAEARLKRE